MPQPRKGRKSRPWQEDPEILARLDQVEERHLASKTNLEIAKELGVRETTIRRDLKRLREIWRERLGAKREDLRARRVAELDNVKRRADREATGENLIPALNVARGAIMDAAKLEGLVVEKVSPTDPEGGALDLSTLVRKAMENRVKREGAANGV
jgi:hypothetical protein